jgi:hypothetical protein
MKRGIKFLVVAMAVVALGITPAGATENTDNGMCVGLAKASAMIEANNAGDGKSSALAAVGLAAEGCIDAEPIECTGVSEPNSDCKAWYRDADGDGFGDMNDVVYAIEQPEGYVDNNWDCDDTDATIYPGAPDLEDGKDNNCDGQVT